MTASPGEMTLFCPPRKFGEQFHVDLVDPFRKAKRTISDAICVANCKETPELKEEMLTFYSMLGGAIKP